MYSSVLAVGDSSAKNPGDSSANRNLNYKLHSSETAEGTVVDEDQIQERRPDSEPKAGKENRLSDESITKEMAPKRRAQQRLERKREGTTTVQRGILGAREGSRQQS
ncbi:Hypothetical_protein [Hexamita inflata]|uniref:Hypothetical_protein n=1 Tax=Hexamita inflata TaxID=28002 RepID=A0ABP1HWN8_9EUKA